VPDRPLVLLHGIGTGPEAWRPQVEAFAPTREVIAPPLALSPAFTVEDAAAELWGSLEVRTVDLCGLSLGALVALRAALDQPSRVGRLVLCAGFATLLRRFRLLQAALGAARAVAPARTLPAGLDRRTLRAVFRAGRTFDVTAELGRLTLPVLVLVGERDGPNRRLSQELAERLPNAELRIVPGAGHVANVDAPEAFNEALREYLDKP
jgi:3-oxoadipate enol-lactonase